MTLIKETHNIGDGSDEGREVAQYRCDTGESAMDVARSIGLVVLPRRAPGSLCVAVVDDGGVLHRLGELVTT